MDVDRVEGDPVHEVQARHHHPRDPEEDDVETGDEGVRRIVALQFRRLLGPAEGRERPQGGREPGIENVLVSAERHVAPVLRARLRTRFLLRLRDVDVGFVVVPGRDLMTPPELARDAPRLDVLEPLEIGLLPGLRHEPRFARTHGGQRALGEGLHVHVPLIREIGLDHRAGAVAVRNRVRMRLDRDEKAALVEQRDDALARLEAIEAVEGKHRIRRIAAAVEPFEEGVVSRNLDLRFGTEHVDERQAVPPPDLEIIEVVRRRDLHRAGALFRIGVFVRDDRDFSADEGQHGVLADEVADSARRRGAPPRRRRRASFRGGSSRR